MLQLGMFQLFIVVFSFSVFSVNKEELSVTAAGLQVLRDNNLIHRDLKPQVS
jgi:serine/threonine protein kinase